MACDFWRDKINCDCYDDTPPLVMFSIANATAGNALNISAINTPSAVAFSPDGVRIFVSSSLYYKISIVEYTLSAAWDITTVSGSVTVNFTDFPYVSGINGISFSSDGSTLLLENMNTVKSYSCPAPYSIVGTSYIGSGTTADYCYGLALSTDNSKVYTTQFYPAASMLEYSISALNPATISLVTSKNIDVSGFVGGGIYFNSNGMQFFSVYANNSTYALIVKRYDVTAAWDISTAALIETYSSPWSSTSGKSTGIWFKPDGTKAFLVTNNYLRELIL